MQYHLYWRLRLRPCVRAGLYPPQDASGRSARFPRPFPVRLCMWAASLVHLQKVSTPLAKLSCGDWRSCRAGSSAVKDVVTRADQASTTTVHTQPRLADPHGPTPCPRRSQDSGLPRAPRHVVVSQTSSIAVAWRIDTQSKAPRSDFNSPSPTRSTPRWHIVQRRVRMSAQFGRGVPPGEFAPIEQFRNRWPGCGVGDAWTGSGPLVPGTPAGGVPHSHQMAICPSPR